jgi:hypothetical protein
MADSTPIPQDSSTDPQVPGNFPGTVQNPTQVPAPVNPAVDPEVSPPPNDVDPNYIPNPAPVNPASDPEVPPATAEFGGGKTFAPEPVIPATNQQVPPAQDLGSEPPIDLPQAPPSTVDPQIPQPDSFPEEGIDLPQALPPAEPAANNTGFDDFYGDQTYTATRTGTADAPPVTPTASNTGFDDFYGEQTYTVNYTGTADAVPTANTGFDDFYGEQTYTANFTGTADARPVTPTTNPQVPNLFSSISALLSNLFGITPTPVAPTANPQVAQPIPVPSPVVLTPTPIPASTTTPTTTTTTNNSSGFGDFYGEQTYTTNYTGTADAVPAANTGFDDFYGEQTYTTNYTGTADTVSSSNTGFDDFYGEQTYTANFTGTADATPVIPASNPEVPQPPDNTALLANLSRILESPSGSVPSVSPTSNAQVPNPPTRVVAVSTETLLQNDPDTAQEYTAFKNETAEQLTAQRIAEQEAVNGGPISVSEQVRIAARAEIDATADANFRYQDQIEAAGAATVVPADTPPPTPTPAAVVNNPQVVVPPTKVVAVSTETLLQNDPDTAQEYTAFKTETAEQLTAQRIAEQEAVNGGPISVSEQVRIAARAEIDATADANFRYQDQIQAAGAGTTVPADTPPPTVAPTAVDDFGPPPNDADPNFISNPAPVSNAIDPEVPQPTAEFGGGKRFAPEAVDDFGPPPNDADPNYIPNPAPVVPATNQQVPPAQDLGSEPPIDLPQAPPAVSAVTNPQVPAAQDLGSEPPIDLPQAPPAGVDPQVPAAQDLGSEPPIDLPQAPPAGVDPQIPQPDSFPEEGIDLPAPVQSPTPYERFLAEENAATDAAQAAATARFNAQFADGGNIIGSSDDPQVNQGDVTDVGEFQAEPPPIPDIDTGYEDFYGIDEVNDVGEFQAEPVDIPNIDTGYEDFYGNEEDVGEFQAEPVDIPNIDTGYEDFYGNEEDVGEFQDLSLEPDAVDSGDTGFGNFSDTGGGDGGDFFGGLFGSVKRSAGAVSGGTDPLAGILDGLFGDGPTKPNPKTTLSPQQIAANKEKAAKALAKQQNIINQQRKQADDGDWRVRLRLAGSADYLYKAKGANGQSAAGILQPLAVTGGVIFPYTPAITTAYQAKYNAYELTHSNYKGYFYQGSSVGDISINATFTAQDTQEANYLLAVIHFFRSVTKMFYGQDDSAHRGAPPPLVFLQGLGEYQFNLHPCVVTNFNYTLPADVDYIRALSPNNDGTNLSNRRSLQSGVTPFVNPSASRLSNAGLPQGGLYTPAAPPTLGTNSPTYVPTKMDIQLTLLAIQTRSQVSKQFSLKEFANGNLIRGGFW